MNKRFIMRSLYIITLFAATYFIGNYAIYFMLQAITNGMPTFFSYDNPMFTSIGITDTKIMEGMLNSILYLMVFAALVVTSVLFSLAWNVNTLTNRKKAAEPKKKAGWLGVLVAVVLFGGMFGLMYAVLNPILLCAEFLLLVLYWEYAWGGNIAEREMTSAAAAEPVLAEVSEELRLFPDESADETVVFHRVSESAPDANTLEEAGEEEHKEEKEDK